MYLSYYTMHSLATCAKVLYDNDILDKQNELDKYKKDMLEPVIIFSSQEEFYNKKSETITIYINNIAAVHNIICQTMFANMDGRSFTNDEQHIRKRPD